VIQSVGVSETPTTTMPNLSASAMTAMTAMKSHADKLGSARTTPAVFAA